MTLARCYLEAGRYTIKEIAFLLGFSDATTFSRAFKRWTRTSPLRYAAASRRAAPQSTRREHSRLAR